MDRQIDKQIDKWVDLCVRLDSYFVILKKITWTHFTAGANFIGASKDPK